MEQKAYKIFIIEDSDKDRELLEKSLASYNLFQVVGMGHRTKRFFQWSGKMGERL